MWNPTFNHRFIVSSRKKCDWLFIFFSTVKYLYRERHGLTFIGSRTISASECNVLNVATTFKILFPFLYFLIRSISINVSFRWHSELEMCRRLCNTSTASAAQIRTRGQVAMGRETVDGKKVSVGQSSREAISRDERCAGGLADNGVPESSCPRQYWTPLSPSCSSRAPIRSARLRCHCRAKKYSKTRYRSVQLITSLRRAAQRARSRVAREARTHERDLSFRSDADQS